MGVSARYHLRHRGHLSCPKERESGRNRAAKLLKKLLAEKPKEKIIFHLIALLWLVILNFLIFPRQFSCASAAARPSVYRFCWFLTCRFLSFGILHGVDVLLVFFFCWYISHLKLRFSWEFQFFRTNTPAVKKSCNYKDWLRMKMFEGNMKESEKKNRKNFKRVEKFRSSQLTARRCLIFHMAWTAREWRKNINFRQKKKPKWKKNNLSSRRAETPTTQINVEKCKSCIWVGKTLFNTWINNEFDGNAASDCADGN